MRRDRRLLVTSHESFGYLGGRYGLRQEGVAGISPDAEPDPKCLGDLADLSNDERRRADDYFSIMERNLARIVDALGCRAASP